MIPVNRPLLNQEERDNVNDCLTNGWIADGKYVQLFEDSWAMCCNRQYGIAVSNGTTALELAIRALHLEKGTEVIVPSFMIMSCAYAVLRNDLVPVFVDVDRDTWCIDLSSLIDALSSKTGAILIAHTFGNPCQVRPLRKIANDFGLRLIEDAAQAHGSHWHWPRFFVDNAAEVAGSVGSVSCFSFYANKLITTGEGGMVLTNHQDIADDVRRYRNMCFGNGSDRFIHDELSGNYRMSNIQAAIGVGQINNLFNTIKRRTENYQRYRDQLKDCKDIKWQVIQDGCVSNHWVNGLLVPDGMKASVVISKLAEHGVGARPFFHPLHLQPALAGRFRAVPCPVSTMLSERGLYLPSGTGTTIEEVDAACGALKRAIYE